MPTTHVFIVNEQSFPVHLRYLFAGTGAGDADEHYELLSDIKRVRVGDKVLFYLESRMGNDGGFFGVFKIANYSPIVIHDTGSPTYLENNLGKKLIYRVRIEPDVVYSKGIAEYKALDDLPTYSTEILMESYISKIKRLTWLYSNNSGRIRPVSRYD